MSSMRAKALSARRAKEAEITALLELGPEPETKLIVQPCLSGRNKGRFRIFIELHTGERIDHGMFGAEDVMKLTTHYATIALQQVTGKKTLKSLNRR